METLPETITVSTDGYSLPISDLMTGRGAVFGKSGSGKSNSVSVIAEELLSLGLPIVVVDIEGEYWGLTERFDVTYASTTGEADVTPSLDNVDELVSSVLVDNQPLVLDVSGIAEPDAMDELLTAFVTRLFEKELSAQKPCLLLVEEVHEFLPQSGGRGDLSETLITVAKRGRKRGLGLCGISQRPAAVDKEFITQCEWIAWHRLTWENDTKVVETILGREAASDVTDLDTGEALIMSDWDEALTRTRFRRKETFDAGATPDLTAFAADDLGSGQTEDDDDSASPSSEHESRASGGDATPASTTSTASAASTTATESSAPSDDGGGASATNEQSTPPRSDSFDPLEEAAFLLLHAGGVARTRLSKAYRRLRAAVRDRRTD